MKMSEWKRIVKELSREISSINKELSKIRKMDKTEREKLGLKDTGDILFDLQEYEKATSFPMYKDALQSRNNKATELLTKKDYFSKVLLGIKCIALYRAKKLSKEAEKHGFLDNKAYAESLIQQYGYNSQEIIDILNKYLMEDNWSFDFFDMNAKDAEKVGKMMR